MGILARVLSVLAIVGLGLALFLLEDSARSAGWTEARRIEADLQTLQQVNLGLEEEVERIEAEVKTLENRRTGIQLLEKAARENFGYIKNGEVLVVLPD